MSSSENTNLRWRLPAILLISVVIAYFDRLNISLALPYIAKEYAWTTEETGNYTTGIMAILGVAFLAGIDLLILSRFLKY